MHFSNECIFQTSNEKKNSSKMLHWIQRGKCLHGLNAHHFVFNTHESHHNVLYIGTWNIKLWIWIYKSHETIEIFNFKTLSSCHLFTQMIFFKLKYVVELFHTTSLFFSSPSLSLFTSSSIAIVVCNKDFTPIPTTPSRSFESFALVHSYDREAHMMMMVINHERIHLKNVVYEIIKFIHTLLP